jgi:hypothetical protein
VPGIAAADIKCSIDFDLDPEEAGAIVDPALKLMMEAVQSYGGYVRAIKTLPYEVAGDPERLACFRREARAGVTESFQYRLGHERKMVRAKIDGTGETQLWQTS